MSGSGHSRRLLLVRHAKAERGSLSGFDIDRTLSERGRGDAVVMGRALAKAGANPDVIMSSPASRALETARLIVREMGRLETEIVMEPDIYEADLPMLLGIVRGLPDSCSEAMLFGHNPGFEELAGTLCDGFAEGMPTCAAVCFDLKADSWSCAGDSPAALLFQMSPKDACPC